MEQTGNCQHRVSHDDQDKNTPRKEKHVHSQPTLHTLIKKEGGQVRKIEATRRRDGEKDSEYTTCMDKGFTERQK